MKGLKKVAGETKSLRGPYSSIYLQLCYDKETDEVFTIQHCDSGYSSQTFFANEDVVNICNLTSPHTMAEIQQLVEDELMIRQAASDNMMSMLDEMVTSDKPDNDISVPEPDIER